MSPATKLDRAALVRRALVELVADNGFRGTSMAAVAQRAGVATGTAYVHYESKDELVLAAYVELKSSLTGAAIERFDPSHEPAQIFTDLWHAMYEHLAADPPSARFLLQVAASPYASRAHQAALAGDELLQNPAVQALFDLLLPLPMELLYDLGLGPAIRLAASPDATLSREQLEMVAQACWRAVSVPAPA